jgi:hypothetical protein
VSVKEFSTAVREAPESPIGGDPLVFTVDGDEWTAYPPTGGQLALVMASMAEQADPADSIAGILNFLTSVLDEQSAKDYRRRLMDRDDPFDIEDVERIVEWLMEEWSARPTKQPSDFQQSRRRSGRRLTATPSSTARTS